jgi:putative hydrolase of the HAD superfamily
MKPLAEEGFNPVRCVIFDFGNVLVAEGLEKAREICSKKTGVDINEVWRTTIKPSWKALERGELAEGDFWKAFEALVNDRRFDAGEFRRLLFENQRYNEKVVDLIKELRSEGYVTALLTNNVKEWIEEWDRLYQLDRYFDAIVSSHEVKAIKPEPIIYEIMLQRLGAEAGECVFIDDKERNLETARRLGMKTVLFRETDRAIGEIRRVLEEHGLGPRIALPESEETRERLRNKLREYEGRMQRYDGAPELLSSTGSYYKAEIVRRLLNEGHIYTRQLSREFRKVGFFDSREFLNAARVIEDYCGTGGRNTRGGTGF